MTEASSRSDLSTSRAVLRTALGLGLAARYLRGINGEVPSAETEGNQRVSRLARSWSDDGYDVIDDGDDDYMFAYRQELCFSYFCPSVSFNLWIDNVK